jgi:chemotaxis response regulator CheB
MEALEMGALDVFASPLLPENEEGLKEFAQQLYDKIRARPSRASARRTTPSANAARVR